LVTLDNVIDTTTGTVKLRADFENLDGALFANQFVNIRLLLDVLKDQVVIPIAAVQHGAPNGVNTTFVYLVNADKTVAVHPIALGVMDGERVAVASGLQPGDIVVTEGGDRLRDGATVTLPEGKVSAKPASTVPGTSSGKHRTGGHLRGGPGGAPNAGGKSAGAAPGGGASGAPAGGGPGTP